MNNVQWNMSGSEIEQESFRRIAVEAGEHGLPDDQWRVARRLIHTTTDFGIARSLHFAGKPAEAAIAALRDGAPIYCDSNMIKSGLSVAKLAKLNAGYTRDAIHCYVADQDVADAAKRDHTTRALAAVKKAQSMLSGAVVLIGNAGSEIWKAFAGSPEYDMERDPLDVWSRRIINDVADRFYNKVLK